MVRKLKKLLVEDMYVVQMNGIFALGLLTAYIYGLVRLFDDFFKMIASL